MCEEISKEFPTVEVVVKATDLTNSENIYQVYEELKSYNLETWVNNAGSGNYASVAQQSLDKIQSMIHLNIEALTLFSTLFVHDYKDVEGTQLINIRHSMMLRADLTSSYWQQHLIGAGRVKTK